MSIARLANLSVLSKTKPNPSYRRTNPSFRASKAALLFLIFVLLAAITQMATGALCTFHAHAFQNSFCLGLSHWLPWALCVLRTSQNAIWLFLGDPQAQQPKPPMATVGRMQHAVFRLPITHWFFNCRSEKNVIQSRFKTPTAQVADGYNWHFLDFAKCILAMSFWF